MANVARGNPARWWKGRSCGGVSRAPQALLVSPIRRWTSFLALSFLLLLLGGIWYFTNPTRISRLSEALLSRVLGGTVRVRSGHLSMSGTLILTGIEVRTDGSQPTASSDIPIFTAEQIEARFDWFSLLSGQLSATQLVATTPVFHPIEEHDTGHWNYERLRPGGMGKSPPRTGTKGGLSLPVVILRDAHVKWGEVRQGRVEQTAETVIDGEMTPDAALSSTYHFQFSQLAPGAGTLAPLDIGATLRGTWDSTTNIFSTTTENVVMSDALRNGLPRQAREWCDEHHLAGRLSQLNMTFNPHDGLVLSVAFDGVSMMWMVAPEPGIAVGEDRPAYPLDVRNVRGKVVFALSEPAMRIIDLNGEVLGYHFIADCDVKGATFDAPFTMKLQFPHATLGDRYPPLFMAFLTSQDLLKRVAPQGVMDIGVDIRRAAARGPLQFDGTIDCHDAQMRFAHFPFPVDHVNGRITFDQQSVTFHGVKGKGDLNDVLINGSTGTIWTNRFVDLTISSDNALFDDRLAACLPEKFQDIWNSFAVRGHGGFVCKVTRGGGIMDAQTIVVDVDLDDGSGYIKNVPYYFSNAKGHLHFESDETRIEHLTARTGADGTGRITLDGKVQHKDGDVIRLLPELHLLGEVPLDPQLLHALPEGLTTALRDTALGGRLAFDGTVRRSGESGVEPTLQMAGTLNWKQGTLKTHLDEQAVALSNITAQAILSSNAIDLKKFNGSIDVGGNNPGLQIDLAGKILTATMSGEIQAGLAGKGIALPATAPALFPKSISDTWREYAPTGRIDLDSTATIRLNMPADPSAKESALRVSDLVAISSYKAGLTLHDVSLQQKSWPDSLRTLTGTIDLVPNQVTMTGMTAAMGNVALSWKGQWIPDSGRVSLTGAARSEGLPAQWMHYLPEGIVKNLDLKREGVALAVRLDSLTREATGSPWSFDGKLNAANLATTGPLRTSTELAELTGKGTYRTPAANESAIDFNGTLAATHMTVTDHDIETLTATIEAISAQHAVTISDLNGKVAGGTLQGKILIHTAAQIDASQPATAPSTLPAEGGIASVATIGPGYQADLVLNDAELSRLLIPGKISDEERKKISSGHVTASLSLQETFGVQPDRTGRGELIVRDGNIYNVPLSMGLMQVVTLRLPVASSFQRATMSYYLRGDEVTFERILLESQGINLAGVGSIGLSDHSMNMSFVTESPHEVSIPVISDILRETRNELLQLSVTGTLDNPKITPVPLSAISNVLRVILPHSRDDTHH